MDTKCLHQTDGKPQRNFVYLLTFTSGKSYVGVSTDPKRRLKEHWSKAQDGMYALSCALKKYGEPKLKILAETTTKEQAFALEIQFIAKLNTLAPNGYNMTHGGEGVLLTKEQYLAQGRKYSELLGTNPEAKKRRLQAAQQAGPKVSKANKEFYATPLGKQVMKNRSNSAWKANVTAANRRPKTTSQIAKLSQAAKQRWQDPEYRKKVNTAREAAQKTLREADPQWVQSKAEKMSAAMKTKWQDSEFKDKMKERPAPVLSKETRAKAQAKTKQFWTEEQRLIAAEKTRLSWEKRRKQKSDLLQDQ
jgi:predicted GIY-YIG superfamily endonuclease